MMSSRNIPGYTAPAPVKKSKRRRKKGKEQINEQTSTSDQAVSSQIPEQNTPPQSCTDEAKITSKPKQEDVIDGVTKLRIAESTLPASHEKPTEIKDDENIHSFENTREVEENELPLLVSESLEKPAQPNVSSKVGEMQQNTDISSAQASYDDFSNNIEEKQVQPQVNKPINLPGFDQTSLPADVEKEAPPERFTDTRIVSDAATVGNDSSMAATEIAKSTKSRDVEKKDATSESASGDVSTVEVVDKVESDGKKAFSNQQTDHWDSKTDATHRSFEHTDDKKPNNGTSDISPSHADSSSRGQKPFNGYENKGNRHPRENRNHFQHDNRNQSNYRGGKNRDYDNNFHGNNYRGRGRGFGGRVQGSWDNQRNQNRPYSGQGRGSEHNHETHYSSGNSGNFQQQGHAGDHHQQNRKTERDYSHVQPPTDVELSKEIVRIVRHGKYKWLKMNAEGYVGVDDILNDQRFKSICGIVSFDWIKHIVESNDKKRFELKEVNSKWFIKATQGHTVQVESLELTPIRKPEDYPNVFHGTYHDAWEQIKVGGLNRMKRNHIHFAIGMPDDRDVISGMRKSSEVAIEIDLAKAMKAGLKFFVSSNNVILSEGDEKGRVHPKFFSRVVSLRPYRLIRFGVPPDFDQTSVTLKGSNRSSGPSANAKKASEKNGESKETVNTPKRSERIEEPNQKETLSKQENKKDASALDPEAPAFLPTSHKSEKKQKPKRQEQKSEGLKKEEQPKMKEPEFELPSASMGQEVTSSQTESSNKKGRKNKPRKR